MTESPATLTRESVVHLHQLVVRPEGDQRIVGRLHTDTFVSLPQVGGLAVELLQEHPSATLAEVHALLEVETGADVDLIAFARELLEMGFVSSVDGQVVESPKPARPNLDRLRASHVRWLFGPVPAAAYCVLVLAAMAMVATHPSLLPRYQDFFWSRSISAVVIGNILMVMTCIAVHELAHLVAARSLGVGARIGLGTRLQHLVVQTTVTDLWSVPRRSRYRVYLAGMSWDLLVIVITVLALATIQPPGTARALLRALVLLEALAIVGQFHLYMRTDMYFVALDLLRCGSLFYDAMAYLRKLRRMAFMLAAGRAQATNAEEEDPLDGLDPRERRCVKLYAGLVAVGSTLALTVFLTYELPVIVVVTARATQAVWTGIAGQRWDTALDGLVTAGIEVTLWAMFLVTFVRNRRAAR